MDKKVGELAASLDRSVDVLSVLSCQLKEDFALDAVSQGAAKWFIFTGISYALDLGKMVLGSCSFESPDHHRDMLVSLRDTRGCPQWLVDSILNKLDTVLDYEDSLANMGGHALYDLMDEVIIGLRHFQRHVLECGI